MNFIKTTFILILSLTMAQCGSSQQGIQEINFDGGNTYFQKWVAGVQGGGSGVHVFFDFATVPDEIDLKEAFFRGMVTEVRLENNMYVARFKTNLNSQPDIVMSNDPVEEMVNTPSGKKDFMIPLAEDEVGITFMHKGILKFAKISNIEEKESIPLPSQRPENGRNKGQE